MYVQRVAYFVHISSLDMQPKVKTEYDRLRAKLILKGTNLKRWSNNTGYAYRTVISAAKQERRGATSKKIRRELQEFVNGKQTQI
jgi:hypothetical protein